MEITWKLEFGDIEKVVFDGEHIALSQESSERIAESYDFLGAFASEKVIYGINTGFGPMAQYRIGDDSLKELQYNIIRSHSTGAGAPLQDIYIRASMLARLGTFVQGYSGVHRSLPELLVEFINRGIYPLVPEHGSVGASGDLVQLAHIALALIGEGEAHYRGQWRETSGVLKEEGLDPLAIHIREGLAATNGTSVMTGIGFVNLVYARRLLDWAVVSSVMMNEIASSYGDLMSDRLNGAKLHAGQREVARAMRETARGSGLLRQREEELYDASKNGGVRFSHKVQPYYSLRCVPQILGPVLDTIANTARVVVDEFNSASDNPIVDPATHNIYHGGNFHGDYVSLEMDKLKIAVTKLAMLAERQLNYLCHDKINGILPPFVNMGTPGLNYGMQASQFTATSTTAECQALSTSVYVHSIPNNNDNQDIVSMGTNSALVAARVIDNAFQVVSIHAMALVQAVDCLGAADSLSPATRRMYDSVRGIVPAFTGDAPKYREIEQVKKFLMNTKLNSCKI